METVYQALETKINKLTPFYKFKCTSDNKEITRGVKQLSMSELVALRDTLVSELATFEQFYQEHKDIGKQCQQIIEKQLEIIRADKKQKEIYQHLNNRYKKAQEAKGTVFSGVSDWGVNIKSIAGTKLMNFIISYHKHQCQYTNMFKEFCGDTKQELHRIKLILDNNVVVHSKTVEADSLSEIKNAIANIELDIDEEW